MDSGPLAIDTRLLAPMDRRVATPFKARKPPARKSKGEGLSASNRAPRPYRVSGGRRRRGPCTVRPQYPGNPVRKSGIFV